MIISTATLWLVIAGLAFGSWLLRFSFLGIIGNKDLPEWVKRHLRYTLVAALVTLLVGVWKGNLMLAIAAGGITLYSMLNFGF
jgi:branched-subunit amino acid transport protein